MALECVLLSSDRAGQEKKREVKGAQGAVGPGRGGGGGRKKGEGEGGKKELTSMTVKVILPGSCICV